MEPFSLQFPYIIGLLDFFFDTEYNAIWCRTVLHWYFSVLFHGLYNAYFSAFCLKQINIICFYLCVFDNSNSNPSFHEEQPRLLPLQLAVTLAGFHFTHWLAVCKWKLSHQKTNNSNISKNNLNLSLLMLYFRPDQSLP